MSLLARAWGPRQAMGRAALRGSQERGGGRGPHGVGAAMLLTLQIQCWVQRLCSAYQGMAQVFHTKSSGPKSCTRPPGSE